MGTAITYPDGTTLTSSALTITQINNVIWLQTMGMLGLGQLPLNINSPAVRTEWPTEGQPFGDVADDVCYFSATLKDEHYDKIRDRFNFPAGTEGVGWGDAAYGIGSPYGGIPGEFGGNELLEQWNYTRVWRIHWTAYGPNSLDNLRALRSGLYQDYFTQQLQATNLFPVSEIGETQRVPELLNGQWIERADVEVDMYEFVTENIQRGVIVTVEVLANVPEGQFADVTVSGG